MLVLGISAVGRGVFGGGLCVGWRIAGRGGWGFLFAVFQSCFAGVGGVLGRGGNGRWAIILWSLEVWTLS